MLQGLTLQMVLAFAVLALAILGFGDHTSPTWSWTAIVGAALALVVFVDVWPQRARLWQEPWTARLGADVAAGLVLPVLIALAFAVSLVAGETVWIDVAIVLAVALAIAALI